MEAIGLSQEERIALTREIFRVLRDWGVSQTDLPAILRLDPSIKRRELSRYRLGNPLPDDYRILHRVGRLLEIEQALHTLFPHSELSAHLWVTTPRAKFGYVTPLTLILEQGDEGIDAIIHALNNIGTF